MLGWSELNIVDFISQSNLFYVFLLCIARPFGVMIICPLFESTYITKYLKAMLAILFAIFIVPSQIHKIDYNIGLAMFCAILVKELVVGFLISYIISFPFWLIENCSNMIDIQRGEQFGAQMNPMAKAPTSSIAKLISRTFVAYFVARHGISFICNLLFQSFNVISLNTFKFASPIAHVDFYTTLFETYFKSIMILAMPAIVAMMCFELVLALISSFVPQLNVTILSMPIKSIIALLVLILYLDNLFYKVILDYVIKVKNIF
jgi:type III secretion protein T